MALIANITWFFASTGAMAEEGIQGAIDADILAIMWDSSVGTGALLRALGLVTAIIALALRFKLAVNSYLKQSALMLSLLCV